jgi:hypothetical protein
MDMNPNKTVIARIEAHSFTDLDALLGMHCGFSSRIIDAFQMTGADDDTDENELVTNILIDLMRISAQQGIDFNACLRDANARHR